ncbi:dual specificity phosphatase 12, partial [Paramuricea clavata]
PNPGFLFQLHLFEALGKKVDKSNSLYKQYNLQIIAKQVEETGYRELPEGMLKDRAEDQKMDLNQKNYKCRKCRHKLFNSENCLEHIPGSGEDFLSWNDKLLTEENKTLSTSKCTSYFIEPLPWMASLLVGTVEGKLCCPKCSGRIGSFNWAGEQCSCGRWVTPAFQLHKSRIDES